MLVVSDTAKTLRELLRIIFKQIGGFKIATQDLRLRGPGEFVGSRQSGVPLLRYADLEVDTDLIEPARNLAERLLSQAPESVERHLARWLGGREDLLKA